MTIARLGQMLSPLVTAARNHAAEMDDLGSFYAPGECYQSVANGHRQINVAIIQHILEMTYYTWEELVAEVGHRLPGRAYRDLGIMEAFSDYESYLEEQAAKRRRVQQMMQPWLPGGLGGMQIAEQRQKAIRALARRTASRAA